ncbi:hypothetical protein F9L16_23675 [Agarivorans sp. B2Z047]|uniref:phage tail assembly chaperone n=1 Tax=Agarivorans sp. B2Z047 TaxID=2652721 RepID=UPI00128C1D44|nr:hypothetical protein [Agarivorans sp. B2Z047]MPW31958.1 hypothetical protein [Agarivorans sp. B2Z047]UQN41877.1 hypothetical protein LQZ07_19175 [Agarivorans sp. B2Z047]UQN44890.1 hypothetical protein LQZ07_10620 [Agarivorans sp. B2Z047]
MAKFEEKTINKQRYKIMLLPPMQQSLFAAKVAQALAPIVASGELGLEGIKDFAKDTKNQESMDKLIGVLADSIPKVDAEKLHSLAKEAIHGKVWAGQVMLGDEDELNKHLEEHPKNTFQLIIWAISANVKVFFG